MTTQKADQKDTYRILAKDKKMNNNTWVTGINNNDPIIGVSGAGKTRSYVRPNLRFANESIIMTDTKTLSIRNLNRFWRKRDMKCG
ncbi:MAG TPA: type IV secretory system conjugative DNA transfer family protein [Candidatus Mediterraneibacter pullistercoris]|nr:type IV secretory system conjugative DNA transfer family protein [Candidatus Mediterraneibacter pullistercoris]